MAKYKGIIRFISSEGAKWALVKQYPDTDVGDIDAEYAVVTGEEETYDLSVNNLITIDVDGDSATDIDVSSGAVASDAVTAEEVAANINAALTGSPADGSSGSVVITGTVASASGSITISGTACATIFGSATISENGVTEINNYNESADGYRLVRGDFIGKVKGDTIYFDYDAPSKLNDGRKITIE